ncbi:MAG: tetratricopeptide repeat protein [Lachnospiraceae bacterium]|nr:tetratricopeptide repeat protein [Lachnospiraceae bacterium]
MKRRSGCLMKIVSGGLITAVIFNFTAHTAFANDAKQYDRYFEKQESHIESFYKYLEKQPVKRIKKYVKYMDLAQQYANELQYDQAIAAYETAIGSESAKPEAYIALADLYVQMGDYESAVAVLSSGIDRTESEELIDYLELQNL